MTAPSDAIVRPNDEVVRSDTEIRDLMPLLLACLLASAGVIHLAMVPSHADEWLAEGIGFAVAGWLQLTLAALILARPARPVVVAAIVANVVIGALWVISRTAGFPAGPHSGHAETLDLIDGTTAVMEALAILVAGALVPHRRDESTGPRRSRLLAGAMPLIVVAITTVVLTSPSARNHSRDAHGDHGAHETADTDNTDGGHTDGGHTDGAHADGGHDRGATVGNADDLGFSLLMNGHQHGHEDEPMDGATTAALARQLAGTADLVELYPTIADAEAGGYRRNGPYSPGLGTHYGKGGGTIVGATIDEQSVLRPMLIYGGVEPSSPLIGFMYIAYGTEGAPEGFAGPNDVWHYHTDVCLVVRGDGSIDAPLGADADDVDPELCASYGGALIENTGYMLHAWTVPGYENPLGVFHETHPAIRCADGTYHTKAREDVGTSPSMCLDAA